MSTKQNGFTRFPSSHHTVENWDKLGLVAQLGEQLLCKQKVVGSIPTVVHQNNMCESPISEGAG